LTIRNHFLGDKGRSFIWFFRGVLYRIKKGKGGGVEETLKKNNKGDRKFIPVLF
jgi:hypothetical protein